MFAELGEICKLISPIKPISAENISLNLITIFSYLQLRTIILEPFFAGTFFFWEGGKGGNYSVTTESTELQFYRERYFELQVKVLCQLSELGQEGFRA